MATPARKLFTPMQLGAVSLKHRVVMAPLTRVRSVRPDSLPGDLMREYYEQRASDGGLIITEAINISHSSRDWLGAPGLYTDDQIKGWKKIVSAVHAKGGYMFAQLWHTGRSSHAGMSGAEMPLSASVNSSYRQHSSHLVSTPGGWVQPSAHRALTTQDIAALIKDSRRAAQRAMDAGFEGVELHAANGYLFDQYLQDGKNKRTDEYGGSIENRSRLLFEVISSLTWVWGTNRVAVRLGLGGTGNGMSGSDPRASFTYIAKRLDEYQLAYLHLIETRVGGSEIVRAGLGPVTAEEIRKSYSGKLIAAGGFEPDTAEAIVESGTLDAVAFGRNFISNPDLPHRIREGLPLAGYDRNTFYTFDATGYTDYPAHIR